jgi:hypothetical protein
MNKCFSVIIPFYRGQIFYSDLIISVKKSILDCDFKEVFFEIITIIDSIDTDYDVINKITLECFNGLNNAKVVTKKNSENIGVAKSRNYGLSIATGNLIHLIDQDDTINTCFYSSIFTNSKVYNFFLVNGNVYYKNNKYTTHRLYYLKQKLSVNNLVKNDFIRSPGQVVFSKELISGIKFPEPSTYKGADDRFFWLKIFFMNDNTIKPIYLNEVLYNAYIHDENYSSDQINLRKSALENWEIFIKENKPNKKLLKSINNDILSLKFSANIKQSRIDNLVGLFYRVIYFLDANKIIRFILKRLNFSFL